MQKQKRLIATRCFTTRFTVERSDIFSDFGSTRERRNTNAVQQMVEAAQRHVCAREVWNWNEN